MIKLPYNRAFTKIEAVVDYFCFVKKSPIQSSYKQLSYRWNWPKSTVADFVSYIESTRFAQEDRWLFEFITKPARMTARLKPGQIDDSKPEPQEQLLFNELLIMQDIKHPFTPKFSEAWVEWINHLKREKNKKFKTIESMQKAVDRLVEKAKTEQKAIDMINGSMSNNWASIHEEEPAREHKKTAKSKPTAEQTTETLNTSWTKTGSE